MGVKEGKAQQALDSVKERLDSKYGIMLLQPAYTRYHLELGEITSYPPGYKEMQVFSAITIPGYPSRKPLSEEAAGRLKYTKRPVPLIWRESVKSTGPSLTAIPR